MEIDLTGKVAVVTGAGRGIGRAVAARLADEGVTVVGLDVNAGDLSTLGAELAEHGPAGAGVVCGITDEDRVRPVMKQQRTGRIINAASFAALIPVVGHAAYASSKAAVVHFTRAIAGELGPSGITANSYAPGMVPTRLNHFTERPDSEQQRLLSTLSLQRWGTADDIADLVRRVLTRPAEANVKEAG